MRKVWLLWEGWISRGLSMVCTATNYPNNHDIHMHFFRPIAKETQGSNFSNDFWNTSGYAWGPCV
jgi:hypothetical protein